METTRDQQYVGRFRIGSYVPLQIVTVGPDTVSISAVAQPDACPVARIYSAVPTRSQVTPVDQSSLGSTGMFRDYFFAGPLDAPGMYFVLYEYTVAGHRRMGISTFEIVGGVVDGDYVGGGWPSGAVISMFSHPQPSGNIFVAHHESGIISLGLRPFLDSGSTE